MLVNLCISYNFINMYRLFFCPHYKKKSATAFHELYEECLNLSRKCLNQKRIIVSLESKANDIKMKLDQVKNSTCNTCQSLDLKLLN